MAANFSHMITFIVLYPVLKPIYMVNFKQIIVFMYIFIKHIALLVDLYHYVG